MGLRVPSKLLEPLQSELLVPCVPETVVLKLLLQYLVNKFSKAPVTKNPVLGRAALAPVRGLLHLVPWDFGLGCELHQPLVNENSKELVSETTVLPLPCQNLEYKASIQIVIDKVAGTASRLPVYIPNFLNIIPRRVPKRKLNDLLLLSEKSVDDKEIEVAEANVECAAHCCTAALCTTSTFTTNTTSSKKGTTTSTSTTSTYINKHYIHNNHSHISKPKVSHLSDIAHIAPGLSLSTYRTLRESSEIPQFTSFTSFSALVPKLGWGFPDGRVEPGHSQRSSPRAPKSPTSPSAEFPECDKLLLRVHCDIVLLSLWLLDCEELVAARLLRLWLLDCEELVAARLLDCAARVWLLDTCARRAAKATQPESKKVKSAQGRCSERRRAVHSEEDGALRA